jgi:predicted NUDIX family phosphoesterase
MTTQTTVEHVLVVPTLLFHEVGYFQGFTTNVAPYLTTLLDPAYGSYRPRPAMEQDPSFKQLIPYCIFRFEDQIFYYRRSKGTGEGRLHGKRSIGVGGHISSEDQAAASPYLQAMQREIAEEVFLESGYRQTCVGLLNDDESEVGKVHLGVVHIFDLDEPKVLPRETSMIETGFATVNDLAEDIDSFETWSQLCLRHVFPNR